MSAQVSNPIQYMTSLAYTSNGGSLIARVAYIKAVCEETT